MQRMLQFPLSEEFSRPVIKLGYYDQIRCLFDTGAEFAVWSSGIKQFLKCFSKAEKMNVKIWAFGNQVFCLTQDRKEL